MISILDVQRGQRLREERTRLKYIQKKIATEVELSELAWVRYEKGERAPDQRLLEQLHKLGFDVLYLVTGIRSPLIEMPKDEQELLSFYRQTTPKDRPGVQVLVKTYAAAHGADIQEDK